MNLKNEKGVTMLALVVTIVVMIILASIVISTSVGDNGLIEQTKLGIKEASIREVEEAIQSYILLKEKDNIKNGNLTDEINIEDLENIFELEEDGIEYNIYTITKEGLKELNIKGKYGNEIGVFKIKEKKDDTKEYKVFLEE